MKGLKFDIDSNLEEIAVAYEQLSGVERSMVKLRLRQAYHRLEGLFWYLEELDTIIEIPNEQNGGEENGTAYS